jgi:hypothetical protein
VIVVMGRTSERQQTSRVLAHEGIAAKATGLVEFESSGREKVKKRQCGKEVFKGGAMGTEGRGWAETARTYVAGSGLKAETDKACHG